MLQVKKTAAAMIALSSSLAFAGTMGPVCTPENVTVPCEQPAWDVGIQALYVQQTFNDNMGYIGRYVVPITPTETKYVDNDIRWGWGFKLEGSYHFNTGNDITINWYHASDNKRTQAFPINFAYQNTTLTAQDQNYFITDPKWDAVNLEFGQHVDYGKRVHVRYQGGLHYANLKLRTAANGFDDDGTSPYTASGETKADLIGPRVGVDASYYLANGWSVYANGAMAMLVGDSRFDSSIINAGTATSNSGRKTIVAPQMEGKLGLNYAYPLGQGTLIADAGYLWVNYFNALTPALISNSIDDSDYAVHGAYFGLKWIGNIA